MEEIDYLSQYYGSYDEDDRLASKHGQVEYLTTMRYIEKYSTPNIKILEIGAGTGRYSHALARMGHTVSAVELVQPNIEVFKKRTEPKENISIIRGNATDLTFFPGKSFDITLLLGPMYHLFTAQQQQRAISEAVRVTKNGGVLFVAYCMSDASIVCYGFRAGNIFKLIEKGLLDVETFKTRSTPADVFQLYLKKDIDALVSGLNLTRLHFVGTDMYTNYMREVIDSMDEDSFALYMKYHFSICERPDLVGITHHSLDILRKL